MFKNRKKIDDFDRPIDVGSVVVYSYGWGSGIFVIRGFGKSGNPLFVYPHFNGEQYRPNETYATGTRYNLFKLEDEWLASYPNQRFVNELMRIKHELQNGTYKKS